MKIVYDDKFKNSFLNIWEFIALDSKKRANELKQELRTKIEQTTFFPYKFRKSIYFNDENIRDLVYKGYTIPYKIDKQNNQIIILGIKKYTKGL